MESAEYDSRYLGGILFFNAHEFFEAHEVWESLWLHNAGPERRFVQGLIQAAVGLHHFNNGNVRGAIKLYRSSRDYMEHYGDSYMGLDIGGFWRQMEICFAALMADGPPAPRPALDPCLIPQITLTPPPDVWPAMEDFADEDE